jgi:dipeptidyl-peptidase 4
MTRGSSVVWKASAPTAALRRLHFQNTQQMANALERAGKQFELMVYPQKAHGVTGPVRKQMLEGLTQFFEKNLK